MTTTAAENLYMPDCIRTVSGQYVNVFDPNPDTILIEDIAHALANQCRFGGHLPKFYSVAQHSVFVSSIVPDEYKMQALMHDASEAYLLDIPSPIKKKLAGYKEIEHNLMSLLADKFGFEWPVAKRVKDADTNALEFEWATLMLKLSNIPQIDCWSAMQSKHEFLMQYHWLRTT